MQTQSKHTPFPPQESMPGVFALLHEFRSYEIQSWLDTTPPNVARALFETGAKLESQRNDLLAALKGCADMLTESAKQHRLDGSGKGHGEMCDLHANQARAAIASAEKGVSL